MAEAAGKEQSGAARWFIPLVYFSNNLLSLAGVVLVTGSAIFWFFLLPQLLRGEAGNPYIGILLYVMLPAVFLVGLALIPLGVWLHRRAKRKKNQAENLPVRIDFGSPQVRRIAMFFAATSFVNVVIASQFTYSAVVYMEGQQFCGATCHVMTPEYKAFKQSAHSNVDCVKCHVGPGLQGFIASKMAGTQQLVEVTLGTYPTPIPPPKHLLSSQETCQNCHSASRMTGDRLKTIPKFADDDTNSRTDSVLLLHVGGGSARSTIHGAHMGPGMKVEYVSGDPNTKISWVRRTVDGKASTYLAGGVKDMPAGELRTMDCMECHTRPAHTYQLPERGIDQAMAAGTIATDLPQAKKQGLAIIKAAYSNSEDAATKIPRQFDAFYREKYPDVYSAKKAVIGQAGRQLAAIYGSNVFPEMKVTWGSYPNNVGHTDFVGCFRCHDDNHVASDSRKIGQDCSSCHALVAMDEAKPKILTELGMAGGK